MALSNMKKDTKEQSKYQDQLYKCENDLVMVEATIKKLNVRKQQLLLEIHQLKKKYNGSITIHR